MQRVREPTMSVLPGRSIGLLSALFFTLFFTAPLAAPLAAHPTLLVPITRHDVRHEARHEVNDPGAGRPSRRRSCVAAGVHKHGPGAIPRVGTRAGDPLRGVDRGQR